MTAQRKKFAPDRFTITIEAMILSGEHPALAGLSQTVQNTYHRLIVFCWRHGRSEIPESYLNVKTLQTELRIQNRYSFISALTQLRIRSLISGGEVMSNRSQLSPIAVIGLEVKIPSRDWKRRQSRIEQNRIIPVGANSEKLADSPKPSVKETLQRERSEFLGHWRSEFLADRGRKYLDIPGDPAAALKIIRAVGLDEAKRLAAVFIRGPADDWQRNNTTVRVMQTKLNAIGGENGNSESAIDRARRELANASHVG